MPIVGTYFLSNMPIVYMLWEHSQDTFTTIYGPPIFVAFFVDALVGKTEFYGVFVHYQYADCANLINTMTVS